MHSLPIREQYNAQKLAVHLCNGCPAANPPVLLDGFLDRMIDYALNPLVANDSTVWPLTGRDEIASALHLAILYDEAPGEKHDSGSRGKIFTTFVTFCLNCLPGDIRVTRRLPAAKPTFCVTSQGISCSTPVNGRSETEDLTEGNEDNEGFSESRLRPWFSLVPSVKPFRRASIVRESRFA